MERNTEEIRCLRHFIWDFDGTLFDTYPVINYNLQSALKEFGYDADLLEMMEKMLDSVRAAQAFYSEKFKIPREDLAAAYNRYHKQANEELKAQPMAGVRQLLEWICANGRHNYIFTHRKAWETRAYLEKYGLSHLFRDIVGPESPGFALKPDPGSVLYLMEKYAMKPEETAMIGDREIDLGSGRNAGARAIHLVCKEVPQALECDWRVEDFDSMLKMLK